jgi:integrase
MRTAYYIDAKEVTRGGKIKNQAVIDSCENIIREWRKYVVDLGIGAEVMSAAELADYLRSKTKDIHGFRLNFKEYMRKLAEKKSASTRHNYLVVASSLDDYHKGALDISEISAQWLSKYEEWLRDNDKADGTIHIYMTLIKSTHNQAKYDYNDEERGIVRIKLSPFSKYKLPPAPAPEARAVDLETIQAIADLDDDPRFNSRQNFARDVFMLSFALGGMNGVDLYNLPASAWHDDYIEYNRTKTKEARVDKALYRVHIHDAVRPLIERWRDPYGKRVFRFYTKFTEASFAPNISNSMRLIEEVVKFHRRYYFYSARHTYASLGYNLASLDKYSVHELLNHTDKEMKITDRYIERDWQKLYDAHDKIIELVDWTKICKERD